LLSDPGVLANLAAIPPLQHGDLQALGLCHWTPVGLIQYSFELVNIWTGLPWFHTVIAATLLWRVFIFPFAVIGMRNTTRMRPIAPQMNAMTQQIQAARMMGDTVAMQKASLEAAKLRDSAGVSMGGLLAPMVQIPISIGIFFGVKKMCELPVMQLTQSGVEWLPDLTQSGPYYILPILAAASGNLMMSLNQRDMDTSRPAIGHVMNGLRLATVLAVPWMDRFPSGLMLCLVVTSLSTVLQSFIFRIPAMRTLLKIPQWTPPPPDAPKLPTMLDTFRFVKDRMTNSASSTSASSASAAGAADGVRPYVPPSASSGPSTVFKTLPPRPAEQRTRGNNNTSSSSLFEDAAPAPAPKPLKSASKPKAKAVKAVKKKSA
ncbi:60Kd inner membrane protein-domain-containing protein, partial [Mycena sanguinolenta]